MVTCQLHNEDGSRCTNRATKTVKGRYKWRVCRVHYKRALNSIRLDMIGDNE